MSDLPGLDPGLLQHVLQAYRRSAPPLALIGRFHENVDFQRRGRIDRWNAGLEELHDPGDQGRIPAEASQRRDRVTPEDGPAVSPLPGPPPVEGSKPAAGPSSHDHVASRRAHAA